MSINEEVFRSYDVRGIYPTEITADLAYKVGYSLANFLKQEQSSGTLNIAVGWDGRSSSKELAEKIKKGIVEAGANVIEIGLSPTPITYFTVWHYDYSGGIQITASHNPKEYNGFKLIQKEARLIAANTGIKQIKQMVLKNNFVKAKNKGEVIKKSVLNDYMDFNLKRFNLAGFKPFKIGIDTANGVGAIFINQMKKKLPGEFYHLFPDIDGNFPNHKPDPMDYATLTQLSKMIKKKGLNLGIAIDGDGDRVFLLDEKGEVVPSSLTTALLAEMILKEKPREKIAYTFCMSNIVPETIKKSGGMPIVTKIGFSFIKEAMRQEKAIFGGEFSGHYAHRDFGFMEPPLFVILSIIQKMSETGQKLSELIQPFKKYHFIGTLNFEVENKDKVLNDLEKKYQGQGRIDKLDGLRIDFDNWWFNLRPSNTEPVVRLVVEAKNKALAEEKVQEIKKILGV